jgi:hypothetical protein
LGLLEMEGANPWSRLPRSEYRSLDGVRKQVARLLGLPVPAATAPAAAAAASSAAGLPARLAAPVARAAAAAGVGTARPAAAARPPSAVTRAPDNGLSLRRPVAAAGAGGQSARGSAAGSGSDDAETPLAEPAPLSQRGDVRVRQAASSGSLLPTPSVMDLHTPREPGGSAAAAARPPLRLRRPPSAGAVAAAERRAAQRAAGRTILQATDARAAAAATRADDGTRRWRPRRLRRHRRGSAAHAIRQRKPAGGRAVRGAGRAAAAVGARCRI